MGVDVSSSFVVAAAAAAAVVGDGSCDSCCDE